MLGSLLLHRIPHQKATRLSCRFFGTARPLPAVLLSAARRYTADHEWVQIEEGGLARIGITDYAQKALGDLVYAELAKIGTTVSQRELLGVVESVKGASDVYAPVSGTVKEVNTAVVNRPSLINKSAEEDGWLCKIEMSDPTELEKLYDKDGYTHICHSAADS